MLFSFTQRRFTHMCSHSTHTIFLLAGKENKKEQNGDGRMGGMAILKKEAREDKEQRKGRANWTRMKRKKRKVLFRH